MKINFLIVAITFIICGCGSSEANINEKEPNASVEQHTDKEDLKGTVEEITTDDVTISDEHSLSYKVFDLEKYEDASKAQIKVSAAVEGDFNDKVELENTLAAIYNQYKDYNDFKQYSSPTVTSIYLFTSEKHGRDMPEGWLAMLVKPIASPVRITINDSRYKAVINSKDDVITNEEKEVAELKKLLASRGLELCSLFKMIGDMERKNGEKAYQKYPNSAVSRSMYQEQLNENDRQNLIKKYRLGSSETIASVNGYGFEYCM